MIDKKKIKKSATIAVIIIAKLYDKTQPNETHITYTVYDMVRVLPKLKKENHHILTIFKRDLSKSNASFLDGH